MAYFPFVKFKTPGIRPRSLLPPLGFEAALPCLARPLEESPDRAKLWKIKKLAPVSLAESCCGELLQLISGRSHMILYYLW